MTSNRPEKKVARNREPKIKKLILEVSPTQGAAMLAVSMAPEGYHLVRLDRKDTRAVITYARNS